MNHGCSISNENMVYIHHEEHTVVQQATFKLFSVLGQTDHTVAFRNSYNLTFYLRIINENIVCIDHEEHTVVQQATFKLFSILVQTKHTVASGNIHNLTFYFRIKSDTSQREN
jgi:hypothetical protein